jgi:ATP-dependent DNA helicase
MQENLSSHSSQIIHSLHAILKPFLLRRLKADVEVDLPPKKEYVLYAPLSVRQREVYDHVLGGGLREYLIGKGRGSPPKEEEKIDVDKPRKLRGHGRKEGRKSYADEDDDEYFDRLESGKSQEVEEVTDTAEMGREYQYKATSECRLAHYLSLH